MADLTHEQLWQVCQCKPGDYEPYGKRNRLMAGRKLGATAPVTANGSTP